jgi:putative acyl-CoA dehydrogenase
MQQDDRAVIEPAAMAGDRYLAQTHEVLNQPAALVDFNLYTTDRALQDAVAIQGGQAAKAALPAFGARLGSADFLALGEQANRYPPELDTHDRFGHRIDLVRFHPAYHALMETSLAAGMHAAPWRRPGPGAHVARAAKFFMMSQVEAGHCCPVTMTFAAVPTLRHQPELAALWEDRITADGYDPRNVPAERKAALTIGMAMTEKQGGSDVRANTTQAFPVGQEGPGQAYELVGHKFFVSAPMSDAFLTLAQTTRGLSCFLLPRWRPDGSKNPMQIQRLKRKMGNVSNASCETELRGALAWMVGEEGRGVRTIIDMVAMTRFDCLVGSSGGIRAATVQALHHCGQRSAFGKRLVAQPLMQNVLADLTLESEAATALAMRMARALDNEGDEGEALLVRLGTGLGKYWVCKRMPQHVAEAMECVGGSGVMEDSPMPRLFRESPVNAIWEGSGNIQCLDMLRAMHKTPAVIDAYLAEVDQARGGNAALDRHLASLRGDLADRRDPEFVARDIADRLALGLQASLLVRHAPDWVAEAFCRSRLERRGQGQYGGLPRGTDCVRIIERGMPRDSRQ